MSAERSLAVVPRTSHALTQPAEPDIFRVGEALAKSGYFQDARDAAQAVVKVIAGRELGIGDVQAMTGIYIVKGRVTLSANLMAALVKRSGRYNYRVLEMTDQRCEIEFSENSQPCGRSAFTVEDARRAGTQNTEKFPRNMLFARAMSNGVRWYCPDVAVTPLYTPDELGAQVDGESGEVIEAEPVAPALAHKAAHTHAAEVLARDSGEHPASQAGPPAEGTPHPQSDKDRETRKKRAQGFVSRGLVKQAGQHYEVLNGSARQPEIYAVGRDKNGAITCGCPDFTVADDARFKCEHIWAVIYMLKPELMAATAQPSDEQQRVELSQKITAELERMGLDEAQMAGYVAENGGQGKMLGACSLAEMRLVAESLEIQ